VIAEGTPAELKQRYSGDTIAITPSLPPASLRSLEHDLAGRLLLAGLTASCSASSSALDIRLKQIGGLAAVVTGPQLPLTLLAGILLPLSLGPGWLRILGHLNPMYYAVEAARDLAAGTITTAAVGIGFLVTGAIAGLALWWGTRSYHRAMV
jgi:ABC-2 type transport system permease protein